MHHAGCSSYSSYSITHNCSQRQKMPLSSCRHRTHSATTKQYAVENSSAGTANSSTMHSTQFVYLCICAKSPHRCISTFNWHASCRMLIVLNTQLYRMLSMQYMYNCVQRQKVPAASCWHSQSQRQCSMYLRRAVVNSCSRLSPLQRSPSFSCCSSSASCRCSGSRRAGSHSRSKSGAYLIPP